jgi:hypothetical protein
VLTNWYANYENNEREFSPLRTSICCWSEVKWRWSEKGIIEVWWSEVKFKAVKWSEVKRGEVVWKWFGVEWREDLMHYISRYWHSSEYKIAYLFITAVVIVFIVCCTVLWVALCCVMCVFCCYVYLLCHTALTPPPRRQPICSPIIIIIIIINNVETYWRHGSSVVNATADST